MKDTLATMCLFVMASAVVGSAGYAAIRAWCWAVVKIAEVIG